MAATNQTKQAWGEVKSLVFLLLDFLICPCRTFLILVILNNLLILLAHNKLTLVRPSYKDGPFDRKSTRALRQHEQLDVSQLEVQDAPPPAFVPAADLHRGHELWRWSQWGGVTHAGRSVSALWALHSHRHIQVDTCSFANTHIYTDTHTQRKSYRSLKSSTTNLPSQY